MVVTLGQYYNIGEKPAAPLYCTLLTLLIALQGHQTKSKNKTETMYVCNSTSNRVVVVIIYFFIGCKYKTSKWYLNGFPDGSNLGSTV